MTDRLRSEIFPSDLARAVAFYESLGFETVGRKPGPPAYASVRLGEARTHAAHGARSSGEGVADAALLEESVRVVRRNVRGRVR